jgi:hypothetical protein
MRAGEWLTAFAGATICLAGAVVSAKSQLEAFSPGQSAPEALWLLPGLVLIDWAPL